MKTLALNRDAKFNYEILETFEAGLVLTGQEVKSIKTGHISLKGSYVVIRGEEAYLLNATIPPYQSKNTPTSYEPARSRKLLLHKREIRSLIGKSKTKGLTLAALRVYTKKGKIKLEFGVGKGRRRIDKRELIRKREDNQKIKQAIKRKNN